VTTVDVDEMARKTSLREWRVGGSYDTAAACEAQKLSLFGMATKEKPVTVQRQAALTACISVVDPRLAEPAPR